MPFMPFFPIRSGHTGGGRSAPLHALNLIDTPDGPVPRPAQEQDIIRHFKAKFNRTETTFRGREVEYFWVE